MRSIVLWLLSILMTLLAIRSQAQAVSVEESIHALENQKEQVVRQEKEALKKEVALIEQKRDNGELTQAEANSLKEAAAKKRALNIEDRVGIIEGRIALLQRNEGNVLELDSLGYKSKITLGLGQLDEKGEHVFGIKVENDPSRKDLKYDRRTYSDIVLTAGFNNAIIEGESLNDSPYKFAGSRFFEIGWQWRTRVFKNTNWLRFHYGLSFQFNGLKPDDNRIFVDHNGITGLDTFPEDLDKAKLRMDNLVFPVHFEFGPSKFEQSEERIRYSIDHKLRIGVGGYTGFNLGSRQKLKYRQDGEKMKDKLKEDYNTNDLVYGLSGYIGWGDLLLYTKYDLNPLFKDQPIAQHNISVGIRMEVN